MDAFVDHLTMGMVKHLEKLHNVNSVTVIEKEPADKLAITSWEQSNGCCLPADLKAFYCATDGIQIQWAMKIKGDAVPVGFVEVNSLRRLVRLTPKRHAFPSELPTVTDIESDSDDATEKGVPRFRGHWKAFILDPCQGHGKVCLLFPGPLVGKDPTGRDVLTHCGVWFQDRALEWHFISPTFTSYLRLALVHLGLPHWQCIRTPWGLPLRTKQLLSMMGSEHLLPDH